MTLAKKKYPPVTPDSPASGSAQGVIAGYCQTKLRREPEDVLHEWAGKPLLLSQLTRQQAHDVIVWLKAGNAAPALLPPTPRTNYGKGYRDGYVKGYADGAEAAMRDVLEGKTPLR